MTHQHARTQWFRMLPDWSRERGGALTLACGAYLSFYLLCLALGWTKEGYGRAFNGLSDLPLYAAAAALASRAARHPALDAHTRRGWRLAAVGYLIYLYGDSLWF